MSEGSEPLASDTTGTMVEQATALTIGRWVSAIYFNGHIKRLLYWNRRLADSALQGLTSGSFE